MHYPWWYVPIITSPMLIAGIATFHVFVAMYAVGGGLFLANETRYANRTKNTALLNYLQQHAWFFILITVVYGAITGVGIWWTIGLASPLATEVLIHIFVFGWAMEYVFFVIEIVSAFIFYYYWGRLEPKTHQLIGWIYAGSAWMSLLIITAITAFMLNAGAWTQTRDFWAAFFNPETIPQTLARTGGAMLLAALYVYLHSSFTQRDESLRHLLARRSTRPALIGSNLILIGGVWWLLGLPESARAALTGAATLNLLMLLIFAVTVLVFFLFYLGPYTHPDWISPGFALVMFLLGLTAVGTGEFIREAVRKPYIVNQVVLGNQILPEEMARTQQAGYLESGVWTKAYVTARYPQVLTQGTVDPYKLLALPAESQVDLGRVLFQHHCNDCHAVSTGLSGVGELTRGWKPDMIRTMVAHPEKTRFFMPPWAGNDAEVELLAEYIATIQLEYPYKPPIGQPARR